METLIQVLDRVVEENQWDEDPDGVIADVRAKCEGIAMGDPLIWEVLIPEAEPADQLLFHKEEMGESGERIALRRLEVVQIMSGILTSKVGTKGYKTIDSLRWPHRLESCIDQLQFRCAFRTFGLPEPDWRVRNRVIRASGRKWQGLIMAIERKRNMDESSRDWDAFYAWLMEYQDPGSRIRAARSADDFLTLTEEFAGEQYQQVAALVDEPEVRAELQQRLDALGRHEELRWPWEALAKAWGVKEDDEPEAAEKRRAVAMVVTEMVVTWDGAKSNDKWDERIEWCEEPTDYRRLFQVFGIPESDWKVKRKMCRTKDKKVSGLVEAIERKRNMDGTAQGWHQFYSWLMEGKDPGSRIRAARSVDDFLSLTEEFAGEQYQQVAALVSEPEVRAELQKRLDALGRHEELRWPWEALAKAWGVKEDDEPEAAEKRRAVAMVVTEMVVTWDGAKSNDKWDERIEWCEEPTDYRRLFQVFGIPESDWKVKRKMCRTKDKKVSGLVEAIERKRNMDGTAQGWHQFYSWLMEGKDPGSRIRAARSVDDFLSLTEEFAGEQYQQVAALVSEPEVRAVLQQRLDALEHPEELQWPWEALAKAWGVKEDDKSEVAEKRRAVATVCVEMVGEKDDDNPTYFWNTRIQWCESREDYRCLFRLLGIPESVWELRSGICEALDSKGPGFVIAIERKRNMDGSTRDWRIFHAWLIGRLPEAGFQSVPEAREYAGKEVARVLETGVMREQLERRREQGGTDIDVEHLLAQLQENPLRVFDHEYMVQRNGGDELTFGNPVFDEAMAYLAKE